jgi:hypothetical protein
MQTYLGTDTVTGGKIVAANGSRPADPRRHKPGRRT